jgi:hypothetical protein
MVDGQLYHLIVEGRRTPDEKTGVMQVRMPGYRYSLGSEEDRWALVHFLRALQLALDPPEVTR